MRDGVKLPAICYFPKKTREEKISCHFGPYLLSEQLTHSPRAYGEGLARRGYVYVYQYCRSQENSEGKWEPNINERKDGIDTMNYLVEQPWCEILVLRPIPAQSMTG